MLSSPPLCPPECQSAEMPEYMPHARSGNAFDRLVSILHRRFPSKCADCWIRALIPVFAEIMALIWVPYSPRAAVENLVDWMPLEHGFIGFIAALAAVYCAYMYRIVTRLG